MAEYRIINGRQHVKTANGRWRKVTKLRRHIIDARPAEVSPKSKKTGPVDRDKLKRFVSPAVYKSLHSKFYKEHYGYGKLYRRRQDALTH